MLRTIKKRIVMLGNRMPFAPEKQKYFDEVERLEWIYKNLLLEGSSLSKAQIQDVLEGTIPQNVAIEEPIMVEALRSLFDEMYFIAEKATVEFCTLQWLSNHLYLTFHL